MSSWAWTPSKARHSWLRLVHVATFGVIISLLYLFYVFAVPQILRFRFRTDLSQYDLGLYGFGPSRGYVSFDYQSPLVEITESASGCDPGCTFLAPRGDSVPQEGPMILDAQGNLVWMKYNWETTQDFKVQKYKGEYFLTYWEGREIESRGYGSWHMLDSTYTQRYVINPVGNYGGDLHEFTITEEGTALVTIYDPTPADLTTVGGPELGWIFDGVFQEIDIETGDLLFEWRASKHYPVSSTYEPLDGAGKDRASAFDYFHINSVDKDDQGNFIISARHTHSVSCIDPKTGSLLWTLGGKMNDFVDLSNGEATNFAWQHDARWHANNTLTLFDNAVHSNKDPATESRGMSIQLDISSRQAKLLAAYYHPQRMKSVSQGNVQMLDEAGRVVVGWGHSAAFSEFTVDGRLLCNVHYGASAFFTFGRVVSYRIFKGDWVGRPQTTPDAEVYDEKVYASWNGATDVTAWRVEAWNSDDLNDSSFGVVTQYEKTGFETEIEIPKDLGPLFRLAALDSVGNVLGVTNILQKDHGAGLEEFFDLHNWILGFAMAISGGGLLAGLYRCCCCCKVFTRYRSSSSEYQLVAMNESDENPAV